MQSIHRTHTGFGLLLSIVVISVITALSQAALGATETKNLAYIDSLSVINGGTFATTDPAFSGYSFYQLTVADISATNIGPGGVCGADGCDTILLNVASSGMACNISTLGPTEQTVLLNFVDAGGKLIIFDSECQPQDYSWLPFPFTTANPGALGASGVLTIVENNVLSSDDAADAAYIDANVLASQTDAIGDMNVMTTQDANWCLDMSGTNAISVTGPVQTYARYGAGLLIYNGMDVDMMGSGTVPDIANGYGNLAKVWLQDLQTPFNPTPASDLPCGATVVGIVLGPATASYDLASGATQHTVTATLKDLLNNPQPDIPVTFSVMTGPNTGASGVCDTGTTCASNTNGEVSYTYTSNGSTGTDEIQACYTDSSQQTQCSQLVTVEWTQSSTPPPTPPPGQDIQLSGSGGSGALDPLTLLAGLLWFSLRRRRK